jgi:DNA-binding NtrC family response regulator
MSEKKWILVVDDEPNIRRILQVAFEKDGYGVHVAENAVVAERILGKETVHCVITDVTMPGKTGYQLLREIQEHASEIPVIIMTAFGTIPQAIQAIRDGAFEFVTKPFDLESLRKIVVNAVTGSTPQGAKAKKAAPKAKGGFHFIAESPAMQEVLATIQQVADSRATVLITGESGAGKEVVAKSLHHFSSRVQKPFVAVSCAALPETLLESELFGYEKGAFTGAQGSKVGRFELAHEGTLFLDEIGEIPMSVQVKLLRVLQEREFERLGSNKPTKVDVRLVTATNRNLMEAVEEGVFRLDLLYRLQVVEIEIPPLRNRLEDIKPLAEHFLVKYCKDNDRDLLHLGEDALGVLKAYRWPGNVRELENTIERAVVLSSPKDTEVTPRTLPASVTRAA